MRYKVIQNFSGLKISGFINQEININDEVLAKDLLRANFIVALEAEPVVAPNTVVPLPTKKVEETSLTDDEAEVTLSKEDENKGSEDENDKNLTQPDDAQLPLDDEDDEEITAKELNEKKLDDLKEICKNLNIKPEGNKSDIVKAILKAYNG